MDASLVGSASTDSVVTDAVLDIGPEGADAARVYPIRNVRTLPGMSLSMAGMAVDES